MTKPTNLIRLSERMHQPRGKPLGPYTCFPLYIYLRCQRACYEKLRQRVKDYEFAGFKVWRWPTWVWDADGFYAEVYWDAEV